MSIDHVSVGEIVKISKINELIKSAVASDYSWINFNGSTAVVRAMYGSIASVTKLSTGKFRIAFTTPKTSINYCVIGTCSTNTSNDTGFVTLTKLVRGYVDIELRNDDGGIGDSTWVMLTVIGPNASDVTSGSSAVITLADRNISDAIDTVLQSAWARYKINLAGTTGFTTHLTSGSYGGEWIDDPYDANLFEVRATLAGGNAPNGASDATGVWLPVTQDRLWEAVADWTNYPYGESQTDYYPGAIRSTYLVVEVREASSQVVRKSANVFLSTYGSLLYNGGGGP